MRHTRCQHHNTQVRQMPRHAAAAIRMLLSVITFSGAVMRRCALLLLITLLPHTPRFYADAAHADAYAIRHAAMPADAAIAVAFAAAYAIRYASLRYHMPPPHITAMLPLITLIDITMFACSSIPPRRHAAASRFR